MLKHIILAIALFFLSAQQLAADTVKGIIVFTSPRCAACRKMAVTSWPFVNDIVLTQYKRVWRVNCEQDTATPRAWKVNFQPTIILVESENNFEKVSEVGRTTGYLPPLELRKFLLQKKD